MRQPVLLLLLTSVGCNSDDGLKVHNSAPEISFTSPPDNAVFSAGASLSFTAAFADRESPSESLSFYWALEDGSTPAGTQTLSGEIVTYTLTDPPAPGSHVLSVTVTDADEASASDAVPFEVEANVAPTVSFNAPLADAVYLQGDPVLLDLRVADADTLDLSSLSLSWSSPAIDTSVLPASPDSSGQVLLYLSDLELGTQALSVSVADATGGSASGAVSFEVVSADQDGDGADSDVYGGDDCDDGDAEVGPGAPERCNGVDDDCDGELDEEGTDGGPFYADADGDGHGDPATTSAACTSPAGYVADNLDCDDGDATISPDGIESCNALDDDCDGAVDEGSPADAPIWYADADADGYGDPASAVLSCAAPAGMAANGEDCDDADAAVHLGADEHCDSRDEDCDGVIDEDSVDAPVWYSDADGDSFGDPNVPLLSCTTPVGATADDQDCDDADPAISPLGTEVCNGQDDDCDGQTDEAVSGAPTWYADADGDGHGDLSQTTTACELPAGYAASTDDCDDTDAGISPSAAERCDGAVDEDCDGLIDDADTDTTELLTFYADLDGDTYGDAAMTVAACVAPEGWVGDDADCDDLEATISPAALEACNGLDDDCDGLVDTDDTVDVPNVYYVDADGDGYGDPSITTTGCAPSPGAVEDNTDCDDGEAAVSPAATESCSTAADDDCDGLTSAVDAVDCVPFYVDADGDGYGDDGASVCQCEPDGTWTTSDGGDCDDSLSSVSPGEGEICEDGDDQDCDGFDAFCLLSGATDLSERDIKVYGSNTYRPVGDQLVFGGDADDDGTPDVWVPVPTLTSGAGGVLMFSDLTTGAQSVSTHTAFFAVSGRSSFGASVAVGGDLTGDDVDDVVIGATVTAGGYASLFRGPVSVGSNGSSQLDLTIEGTSTGDYLGCAAVTLPDIDGDGFSDLALGAWGDDTTDTNSGAVSVFYGPITRTGTVDAITGDLLLVGSDVSDYFGYAVADAGDFDGDGLSDLLVGAYNASPYSVGGAAYVYTDPGTGVLDPSGASLVVLAETSSQYLGREVAGLGDVDGDGKDDVGVGAPGADVTVSNGGAVYVYRGGSSGSVGVLSGAYAVFSGSSASLAVGDALSRVGDVNGDGADDLIVGSPADSVTGSAAGMAGMWYGPISSGTQTIPSADVVFYGETAGDAAGTAVAGGVDINADGFDEVLIGAPGDDDGGSAYGAFYLFFGGG